MNWTLSKLKPCVSKDTIKKVKDNTQNGRKYLQITYLIRDKHPEYIKNSYNFFFLFFFFLATPHGLWDLSSPTKDCHCSQSAKS